VTLCVVYEQPPGMMMSPMMRGVNTGGYYPGPYDVSCRLLNHSLKIIVIYMNW